MGRWERWKDRRIGFRESIGKIERGKIRGTGLERQWLSGDRENVKRKKIRVRVVIGRKGKRKGIASIALNTWISLLSFLMVQSFCC